MRYKKIKSFILTVDGKSSSGKSTAAKLLSKKLSNPPITKKKHEVKKTKLILSQNNFLESYQKLITKEINKNIIDNEIADGKRNKPNKKNNLPVSK